MKKQACDIKEIPYIFYHNPKKIKVILIIASEMKTYLNRYYIGGKYILQERKSISLVKLLL